MQPNCTVAVWHNLEQQTCALKEKLGEPFPGNRVAACRPVPLPPPPPIFRFSTAHSDHMVLQSDSPAVWGMTSPGDEVTIRLGSTVVKAVVKPHPTQTVTLWTAALPPADIEAGFTPYTISAHSKLLGTTINITDVLFGDVCVYHLLRTPSAAVPELSSR